MPTIQSDLINLQSISSDNKPSVLALNFDDWQDYFASINQSRYRTKQVMDWIYAKNDLNIENWLNISINLRQILAENFSTILPKITNHQIASDGVQKWLINLNDNNAIETVMIPKKNRRTLCISSQVGCILNCQFCATARQGFVRNLKLDEIIAQVFMANWQLKQQNIKPISNIVFMGMGEPLLNAKAVLKAVEIFHNELTFGLSKRKITISTAGVVPEIEKIGQNCSLALSLHAANDELRNRLVPLNKKYPLKLLKETCQKYLQSGNHKKHIFIEYVMLKNINDSIENAKELADFAQSLKCKINLIPFNDFPNSNFQCSSEQTIEKFKDYLHHKNIRVTIREQRGFDIASSCGQLVGDINSKFKRS